MANQQPQMTEEEYEKINALMKIQLIIGVHNCKSIDRTILCNQMYNNLDGDIPLDQIEYAYNTHLLELVGNQIITNGVYAQVNPECIETVEKIIRENQQLESN